MRLRSLIPDYRPLDRFASRLARALCSGGKRALALLCPLLLAACAHTDAPLADRTAPTAAVDPASASAPSPEAEPTAGGSCRHGLQLEGMLAVPTCPEGAKDCRYGRDAVSDYAEHIDSPPEEFSVLVASSPWRFYDGNGRILRVESLVEQLRSGLTPGVREVVLYAGWSGVAPEEHVRSLAAQVSEGLDRFPVRGMPGFLSINPMAAFEPRSRPSVAGAPAAATALRRISRCSPRSPSAKWCSTASACAKRTNMG